MAMRLPAMAAHLSAISWPIFSVSLHRVADPILLTANRYISHSCRGRSNPALVSANPFNSVLFQSLSKRSYASPPQFDAALFHFMAFLSRSSRSVAIPQLSLPVPFFSVSRPCFSFPLLHFSFRFPSLAILCNSSHFRFQLCSNPFHFHYRGARGWRAGVARLMGFSALAPRLQAFYTLVVYSISNLGVRGAASETRNCSTTKRPLPELRHWPMPWSSP